MHQAALDHRGVADEPAAVVVVGERVHPAERVLPVGVLEVALEDLHEHGAELVEELGLELGGVGDADHSRSTGQPLRSHSGTPPSTTWITSSAPWRMSRLAPTAERWPEPHTTATGLAGSMPSGTPRMSW